MPDTTNKRPIDVEASPVAKRGKHETHGGFYVVSLLSSSYGKFCSPQVIGIYTTKTLALESAQQAFQDRAVGDRVDGWEDNRNAYKGGAMRVFLEVIDNSSTLCVAINLICKMDQSIEVTVPLLRCISSSSPTQHAVTDDNSHLSPGSKVYVLMENHSSFDARADELDSELLGVYSTKAGAIAAAKDRVQGPRFKDEEEIDDEYWYDYTETVGECGLLFDVTTVLGNQEVITMCSCVVNEDEVYDCVKDSEWYRTCPVIWMNPLPYYRQIKRRSRQDKKIINIDEVVPQTESAVIEPSPDLFEWYMHTYSAEHESQELSFQDTVEGG